MTACRYPIKKIYPMKTLYIGIICLMTTFSCISIFAQKTTVSNAPVREPDYKKPHLFGNLPQRMNIELKGLDTILQYETGKQVSFELAPNFTFKGVVSSVANKYENTINTIVIRSTNFQGAVFSISKTINPDGTSYFSGRIISFQHGDGYEINNEDGQYYLIKKGFYDMVNE